MESYQIKPTTPTEYERIEQLLSANDSVIYHPRTKEKIVGVPFEKAFPTHSIRGYESVKVWAIIKGKIRPSAKREAQAKGNLGGFAAVTYHRMSNRSIGRRMVKVIYESPFGTAAYLDLGKDSAVSIGRSTVQYRTSWFTKHSRKQ
jgi:hypothetical protein